MTDTITATRQWSTQQLAIFDWFRAGAGHLVVRARAGTGKTTTILEAIRYAPEGRIILCAFNRSIAEELTKRNANPNAVAKTLHGIGYMQIRQFLGNVRVDDKRARLLTELAVRQWGKMLPPKLLGLVTKLHTKAREIEPLATKRGDLLDLAYQFECEPGPEWAPYRITTETIEEIALVAMQIAATDTDLIKRSGIDYADMLYLPVRNHWLAGLYDLLVVDEAQDMSKTQLLLAQGILADGGRMAIIGDDRQAIYGFRGADSNSIDRLKTELQATELGLHTTYRCGKSIVSYAARLVPDFLSGAQHEGAIEQLAGAHRLVAAAEPGDYVLSRKNAPLAGVALSLLRANKRATIAGRDFGRSLLTIVDKVSTGAAADSVPAFIRRLGVWRDKEVERAIAANKESRVDEIIDKAETILALTEGVVGMKELRGRLETLFTDDGLGAAGRVTCSSIHKAKGLEADRVFVLVDTLFPTFKGMTPAKQREEENLAYVAYTRAKQTLVLVRTENVAPPPPNQSTNQEATDDHQNRVE